MSWRPTSALQAWRDRADLYAHIRSFFAERDVLPVETPLLDAATATDPAIDSFQVSCGNGQTAYLQTSPEFAMKRLLAHKPIAMYQLCKAFRREEVGAQHQVEFTMLEWYRPGWSLEALMQEVGALLQSVLGDWTITHRSYAALFQETLQLNPHTASVMALQGAIRASGVHFASDPPDDRDSCLHCLMSHVVEPMMQKQAQTLWFVSDFPASQAALAQIKAGTASAPPLAQRFEVYGGGFELANGYLELLDATEQRQRMMQDNQQRIQSGKEAVPIDERLLAALGHGLPPCAGVALGVDRLMMLRYGYKTIQEVVCFGK